MAKAGYFARPIEADGKHHPQIVSEKDQEPARWSDTVHKVADTVRGWLIPSASSKEN
ncbi:hypothetical protein [Roseomonas indoligenes]|uniref:Uncharacterized protein n=1 Tax=Roseomonas indoligenes TaxID=2820811 RepID=A0A940S8W0_9PROT|nr:hypothetical protein [Pararoseomonas indoligenes]MBP0496315.1 hypothetical protein [Pararoseomonas indoligenes]